MKMFASDNNSGVHPAVMEAMMQENKSYGIPYGEGDTSNRVRDIFRDLLGRDAEVYFVTTGTAANIIGLSGLLEPYEGVIGPTIAHIDNEECNALERFNGSRIFGIPVQDDGKIRVEDIEPYIGGGRKGNQHLSQIKVITISQVSEIGVVYTQEEIKELADFAHENDMYLHMDGARIVNAMEAEGLTLKEMVTDTGVDLLSFGGTKNGMMLGEAIISFVPEFNERHKYGIKQGMQLLSKMRLITSQFLGYFGDDLWLKNAKQANEMGRYLASELEKIDGIELVNYDRTNMVFFKIPTELSDKLKEHYSFSTLHEEENIIRLVTSYDMEKEDIDKLISVIK